MLVKMVNASFYYHELLMMGTVCVLCKTYDDDNDSVDKYDQLYS